MKERKRAPFYETVYFESSKRKPKWNEEKAVEVASDAPAQSILQVSAELLFLIQDSF